MSIAAEGYERQQPVRFPLYPLPIRAGSHLEAPSVAAVAISLVAHGIAAVLAWRWLATTTLPRARATAIAVLLHPYGWFLYGVTYADALFLALALGGFVAFEHDRRTIAALATTTRPSGFARSWYLT